MQPRDSGSSGGTGMSRDEKVNITSFMKKKSNLLDISL